MNEPINWDNFYFLRFARDGSTVPFYFFQIINFAPKRMYMKWYEISISVMAMVALFIHSMDHFANNLKKRIGDRTNRLFSIVSNSRPKGFLFGFVATGIVQSSSVVISILISFVDSGMISFTGSLPILLGSHYIGHKFPWYRINSNRFYCWLLSRKDQTILKTTFLSWAHPV